MSLAFVILVGLVFLVCGFATRVALLWLGAKLARIEDATLFRALWTCAILLAFSVLVNGTTLAAHIWIPASSWDSSGSTPLVLDLLVLAVAIGVQWVCIKCCLRATFGRAAIAGVVMLAGSFGLGLAIAFTLKWTLIEGFLIPTGATAPAIYGAHTDIICSNCGLTYAVSLSDRIGPRGYGYYDVREKAALCPNCREPYDIPVDEPILSGDRVLVDKISHAKRWDLVVFKYPKEPSVNYIKRLVGLPGETLEIYRGDIFVDGSRVSKPPGTVDDMWLFVHDTQYVAGSPMPDGPRWKPIAPSSHWKQTGGKWECDTGESGDDVLAFSGTITDEVAYNGEDTDAGVGGSLPIAVGDIKIACEVEKLSGGRLSFRWEFGGRKVTATVSAIGNVEMIASTTSPKGANGEETPTSSRETKTGQLAYPPDGTEIAFTIRDGEAFLMQGDEVVASLAVEPESLDTAKHRGDVPAEPCTMQIVASGCDVSLSRIAIQKDVYYCNLSDMSGPPHSASDSQWGCTDHPIQLGNDELFFLGDNSRRSMDSRFWGTAGTDAVIGVTRWIYWPVRRWCEFD